MDEPKGLKGEIKILQKNNVELREDMVKLREEIKFLGIVLHGSGEIKGIYQRLKESETTIQESNKKVEAFLTTLKTDIDEKFQEQNDFKIKIEAYMDLFSSKTFWRIFTALIVGGALLVAWSKGGYFAFIKFVRELMNGQ